MSARFGCKRFAILAVFLAGALALSGAVPGEAEAGVMAAPVNQAWVHYMDRLNTALANHQPLLQAKGHGFGFMPSRVDHSYLNKQSSSRLLLKTTTTTTYPASFDMRTNNWVPPVRDQSDFGTCWTFATTGSLESAFLKAGNMNVDFSEQAMADFSGFDLNPAWGGGSYDMAAAYLARWGLAPVPQKHYAYHGLDFNEALPPQATNVQPAVVHIQDVLQVPISSSDLNDVKQIVYGGNAVAFALYAEGLNGSVAGLYNATTYGDYDSNSADTADHAVDIIGWNDNYPASNFDATPPGPGAWLVRNSWGTSWGDAGYFWVSYYDATITGPAYSFRSIQAANNYDWIYQYDTLGETDATGYGATGAWMANVFKATPSGHVIYALSTYAAEPNSTYTVKIYDNVTDPTNPTSGTLAGSQTGTISAYAGYHTIYLSTPATVTVGDNFSVVVNITTPGYTYPIPMSDADTGYSTKAVALPRQSFISPDGTTWTDTTSISTMGNLDQGSSGWYDNSVCLKAFAKAS